jgi:hypothetical protein
MKKPVPERLLEEMPPPREKRDSLVCQFLDAGTLSSLELRGLGSLLERQAVYGVSFRGVDPAEWAMQAQTYFDGNERQLGGHPHTIVVLENVRRVLGRTVRSRERHLGFVVRTDYNPAAAYADRT